LTSYGLGKAGAEFFKKEKSVLQKPYALQKLALVATLNLWSAKDGFHDNMFLVWCL
jgi:hypothetical protein